MSSLDDYLPAVGKSNKPAAPKASVKPTACAVNTYLDNASTTLMCKEAKEEFIKWAACYNPSSDSVLSKPVKELLENASQTILDHCNTVSTDYTVLFTSGATESNSMCLQSAVFAFKKQLLDMKLMSKPHIITSMIEHHSIIETCRFLETYHDVEVTYLQPNIYGSIPADAVEKAITPTTCIISIMYANNELGAISNIVEILKIARKNKIPFHSDCVQIFGKYKIDLSICPIDAISARFHKFQGPKGVGLLILNNKFISGYKLPALIAGSQQGGLRGGTENVAGIAAGIAALKVTFKNRSEKNAKLYMLRDTLCKELSDTYKIGNYIDYVYEYVGEPQHKPTIDTKKKPKEPLEIVFMGNPITMPKLSLNNILCISVAKNKGTPFCNVKLKKFLDDAGVTVSIGSACLTKSDKASHVMQGIAAPDVIRRGVIRISMGDTSTKHDIAKFMSVFKKGVEEQCKTVTS